MKTIDRFDDDHEFLSNFFPCRVHVLINGKFVECATVEHAYQAYKTPHDDEREAVIACRSPGAAKRLGQTVSKLASWDDLKIPVMRGLLYEKFQDPELQSLLYDTSPAKLIEGNHWHDNFWGDCHCGRDACEHTGKNWLGKLLMKIRADVYRVGGESEKDRR